MPGKRRTQVVIGDTRKSQKKSIRRANDGKET